MVVVVLVVECVVVRAMLGAVVVAIVVAVVIVARSVIALTPCFMYLCSGYAFPKQSKSCVALALYVVQVLVLGSAVDWGVRRLVVALDIVAIDRSINNSDHRREQSIERG